MTSRSFPPPEATGSRSAPGRWHRLLANLISAGLLAASAAGQSVRLELGSDFAATMAAHPPGTSYIVAAGVHRGVALIPKDGDTISGEPGAVLNGSLQLAEWRKEDSWWVHDAPVVLPDASLDGLFCAKDICRQSQDLYVDDRRLEAVEDPSLVYDHNQWFFDKANSRILLNFDPRQSEVELGGPSMVAIDCLRPDQPVPLGVVIENLIIEKYPVRPHNASVQLGGGATIRNCEIRWSHSYGVIMSGPDRILDCYIHNNGMGGIGGGGQGGLVEGCEIASNVWDYYAGRAWDNGGVKLASAHNVTFRRNYVHHNAGPGIWTDIKSADVVIEDNIVEFNHWEGLLPELSNHFVLRRNICRWNGVQPRPALWGAQICIQNSNHILVENNYLETGPGAGSPWGDPQGVMLFNQDVRKLDEGNFQGSFDVHDVTVRNNVFLMPDGGHNGIDYGTLGWQSYQDFLDANLVWRNNRYLLGRPLFHQWSWRLEETWDKPLSSWLRWEAWSALQDQGSTLETFGPETYPPTSNRQHALIKEVTGHDYVALKQSLTRRPAPSAGDEDGDGLTDAWELAHFDSVSGALPSEDPDDDGLSNLQEQAAGTSPTTPDTDEDGLPDGWEVLNAFDPGLYDSERDPDGNGRSAREDYEDAAMPPTEGPVIPGIPQEAISVWLTPSSGVTTAGEGDTLASWHDSGPANLAARWAIPPRLTAANSNGVRLVDTTGTSVQLPGQQELWGSAQSGFTLTFVFQPAVIDESRRWLGLLTNEKYLETGFRLRLESGYLVWSAGQSGGSLAAESSKRLRADQPHVVTLVYGGATGKSALYVDGVVQALDVPGTIVPGTAPLSLGGIGGVEPQPGRFGDLVIFNRRLGHAERHAVEGLLRQKFITTLPDGDDKDRDGLPDTWEVTHGLDPLTPNALSDADADGVSNRAEFQAGLRPDVRDTDGDGLPDGWELQWRTDPRVADAEADPDADGLSNRQEFDNSTDPNDPDGDPLSLTYNRIRLWWRANHALVPSEPASWQDGSPSGNAAQSRGAGGSFILAPETLTGWRVVRLDTTGFASSNPIDTSQAGSNRGATAIAVLRPPSPGTAANGYARLLVWGDIVVGVTDGRLALSNADASVSGTSTTVLPEQAFILTCLASADGQVTLKVNGLDAVSLRGFSTPLNNTLVFGGASAWPADVAEVVVHAGMLAPLDRRFFERVLQGKWLRTGPLMDDADADGLPAWWEHEAATDPTVADADGDADWDGVANLAAYQSGSPGFVWVDVDRDGMHDGWERAHDLDPAVADGELDPDLDGLPSAIEHALLLPPRSFTPSDAWLNMTPSAAGTPHFELLIRNSLRSWAAHPHWESTTGGDGAPWVRAAPSTIVERIAGSVVLEKTELMVDPTTDTRLFLRVRLDTR